MAITQDLNVQDWFGGIDIYLFDQVLKDRLHPSMRVLDAGCGNGRNLVYFFRTGYEVCAVDQSAEAIAQVRLLASSLAPNLSPDNFRVEPVDKMSFPAADFEVVISSAVLHFAKDESHWLRMVAEMWRVLAPGGIFFARLASTVGMGDEIKLIAERRYHLPDGSERFLVDEQLLLATTEALGGQWLEPLKTVVVHHTRSMTTWCLRKTAVPQIR